MKKLNLILLIDDNDADNDFHGIVIQQTNITAQSRSISSSLKALEYLSNCLQSDNNSEFPVPDLIFLDINMPALSGFELLDKLREIPDLHNRKKGMRIYMLSGSLNPDDHTLALEKYSDLVAGFKLKPLMDTTLSEIVQNHF